MSENNQNSAELLPWSFTHLEWLNDTEEALTTEDGKVVKIYELNHNQDDAIMSSWAKHFRNHYCKDYEIDDLRRGFGLTRCEYLKQIKFPDQSERPGPSVRSADFGEVLVADYLEFRLNFTVPRTRYGNKANKNESPKGVDVIGFKMQGDNHSPTDELATYEVKCALVGNSTTTLQRAINDSSKDFNLRKAESLNAIKQRLRVSPQENVAVIKLVERFQNKADRPYREISGAGAVHATNTFRENVITNANCSEHPNQGNISLIVISGDNLMRLANELYWRAADEA